MSYGTNRTNRTNGTQRVMSKSSMHPRRSVHIFLPCATIFLALAFATAASSQTPQTTNSSVTLGPSNGQFNLKLDAGAIVSLRRAQDRVDTDYIQTSRRLGDVFLRYRGKDGAWVSAD